VNEMIDILITVPDWFGYLLIASLAIAVVNAVLSIYDSYLKAKLIKLKGDV